MTTARSTVPAHESLEGDRPMTRRFPLRRAGTLLLAGALLFVLAGDRGITASTDGIDPLQVLDLQVKPNVIINLDTSGSMEDTPFIANPYGGDHPRSKIWQAKQVLKAVIQDNQSKASFMFGTYRYASPAPAMGANMVLRTGTNAPNRFVYAAQSWAAGTFPNPACTVDPTTCPSPNPATVTLLPGGPSPTMETTNLFLNSLYAFQWIQNGVQPNGTTIKNNTLVFNENARPNCTILVDPGFYANGDALAANIQAKMNGCSGNLNTYAVTYGQRVLTVTALSRVGTLATATTSVPHNLLTGASVTIAGAPTANPPLWNGAKTITVTGPSTFTYAVTNGGPTTATGTMTATVGTANRFVFQGTGTTFVLQWGNAVSTLAAVLNLTANQTVSGTGLAATANDARVNLLQRTAANTLVETFDPDGPSTTLVPTLDNPSPQRKVTTYNMDAQKYWNGETVVVDASGNAVNIVPGPAANPPTVTLQLVGNPTTQGTFVWGGGQVGTGAGTCNGYSSQVPLIPCDQTSPPQYNTVSPYLDNEIPLNADGSLKGYSEATTGTGAVLTNPSAGGVIASGNTPLAQAINDVATLFASIWNSGAQNVTPIAPGTAAALPGGGIKTHLAPRERTIFILVTDGDQNCTPFTLGSATPDVSPTCTTIGAAPYSPTSMCKSDAAALGAAAAAQKLYNPDTTGNKGNGAGAGTVNADGTINGDPAGSVTTYLVAYGNGAEQNRANWIAWGGSGMKRTLSTYSANDTWTTIPSQAERNACKTCIDALMAPDPDTLKSVLEKVINQGATSGEFTAQQSLTDSIYEFAGDASSPVATYSPLDTSRYMALTPVRFVSTFSLPLFTGQIRAYTQGGPASLATANADCAYTIDSLGVIHGDACLRWSANDGLVSRVANGMTAACPVAAGAGVTVAGQCNFAKLWASADDTTINSSTAGIKRRIYTTSQNGVFGPTVAQLIAGQSPYRVSLWPPQTSSIPQAVAPANDTGQGLFDTQLGLPLDSDSPASAFPSLRTKYGACNGSNLPAACPAMTVTSGFTQAQMQRARREAREMILAFLAGAQFVPDASSYPKRASGTSGGYVTGDILYAARSQIVAESTLATPAVVSPPQEETPDGTPWGDEYLLYRDGLRPSGAGFTSGGSSVVKSGFGLRNPESYDSGYHAPVMSVLYAGTNSALHAFRAGPSVSTVITAACTPSPATRVPPMTRECGGDELWAFVPYDQLGKLASRYVDNPQKRDPHDYMIASAVRFSDVFVPNPGTASDPSATPTALTANGTSLGNVNGVWRKIMFFGRGIGGKYMTAIDVTGPGPFTDMSLTTTGPLVLWNRGNPDTANGALQGQAGATLDNTQADYNAYAKMGETWSVPALGYVGRGTHRADNSALLATATTRKPSGADFVMYMGSGYGNAGEGTTFYSLDPLTGDVITSVDVEQVAQTTYPELKRSGMAYSNALVASVVLFNPSRFVYATGGVPAPNVAAASVTRAYVGDLYGRVWKFLTAAPDIALPVADLGANQPVGTAAALLGLPPNSSPQAYVYVTTGNDNRATVSTSSPFGNFGFHDGGSDTATAVSTAVSVNGITVYPPMDVQPDDTGVIQWPVLFQPLFRGTAQPSTAYSDDTTSSTGTILGRVFFAGTRFNAPNTQYAPVVPPYPCRSSFDTILYGLAAKSGLPAYSIGAYAIFQGSRVVAVSTEASPTQSKLVKDEGLSTGGAIQPPPEMGRAPQAQVTSSVVPAAAPGAPQPTVRFGSTVCQ